MPDWVSYVSVVVFLSAYLIYAEVLRENTYLSRTIEVQEDQKVIDTGLYGTVRHCPPPDVLGNRYSFPRYAVDSRFSFFVDYFSHISVHYRKADQ